MKDPRYIYLSVFIAALVFVLVGWRVYGDREQLINAANENLSDPLIEIQYSGGMAIEPAEVRGKAVITKGGELVVFKRSGGLDFVERVPGNLWTDVRSEMQNLERIEQIAERKEEPFCVSWVDGVDLIYTFYTEKGELVLSECDWTPDDTHPLMQDLDALLR